MQQSGALRYLIRFAPLAFAPHRRTRSSRAPSPQVVPPGLQECACASKHIKASLLAKFHPYPGSTLGSSRSQGGQFVRQALQFSTGFHRTLTHQATGALGPVIAAATCGSAITAAAASGIAPRLFPELFRLRKSPLQSKRHFGWLRHACAHCGSFATAAPRRAWTRVSESIWGLLLSQPLRIIGTSARYADVNLIRRTPILGHALRHFQGWILPDTIPYEGLAPVSRGYPPPEGRLGTCYSAVRRCSQPREAKSPRLACLSPSRIAAASGRINQNWRERAHALSLLTRKWLAEYRLLLWTRNSVTGPHIFRAWWNCNLHYIAMRRGSVANTPCPLR